MPRSRSKSPARRTRANPTVVSPAPASPEPAAAASPPRAAAPEPSGLDDAQIQLGIAVVILTAVWYQCSGGSLSLNGFTSRCADGFDFTIPQIPDSVPILDDVFLHIFGKTMNLVATLHLVNTIVSNRNSGGFWLQNFATTLLAGYAVTIVPAILSGTTPVDAIFSDEIGSGVDVKTFFVIWYLINYGVGPINYELWEKFTGIIHVGGALQVLMSFASLMYVSKAVGGAVGPAQTMFTQGWFRAVAGGLVAAGANGFFPLSKGFSLEKNAAFAPVFFLASNGFASIDSVVGIVLSYVDPIVHDVYKGPDGNGGVSAFYTQKLEIGAKLNDVVGNADYGFGDHLGSFVIGMIAINFLFGSVVRPLIPIDTNDGFDVLGFVAKFTALIQLN